MTLTSFFVFLAIGAIAGFLAGRIVQSYGKGLIGNILVGIVGAFIAGTLLPWMGFAIGGGILASIINATVGAVVLLLILRVIRR